MNDKESNGAAPEKPVILRDDRDRPGTMVRRQKCAMEESYLKESFLERPFQKMRGKP